MIIDFYPLQKRWRKVGPIYRSRMAAAIWHPNMEAYAAHRAAEYGYDNRLTPWTPELTPSHYDSCSWRWDCERRGPQPGYWAFTCAAACHWLVDLHLWVAQRAEPSRSWHVVTSDLHSTVWDGEETIWDANFMAMGVSATDAIDMANGEPESRILPAGEMLFSTQPTDPTDPAAQPTAQPKA